MNLLFRLAAAGLLLCTFRPSWAGEEIRPSVERNAAPTEQLDHYARFELKPVQLVPPYAGQETNEKARDAVQDNLQQGLGQWAAQRNAEPAKAEPARTLVIEPVIEKVRFISGGKRFFAGAFAGSSRILLRLRLIDAATGEVVAQPEFYQHARHGGRLDDRWRRQRHAGAGRQPGPGLRGRQLHRADRWTDRLGGLGRRGDVKEIHATGWRQGWPAFPREARTAGSPSGW